VVFGPTDTGSSTFLVPVPMARSVNVGDQPTSESLVPTQGLPRYAPDFKQDLSDTESHPNFLS